LHGIPPGGLEQIFLNGSHRFGDKILMGGAVMNVDTFVGSAVAAHAGVAGFDNVGCIDVDREIAKEVDIGTIAEFATPLPRSRHLHMAYDSVDRDPRHQ
jgi:hypothetical protein